MQLAADNKHFKVALLLCLSCALAACGFQLRGTGDTGFGAIDESWRRLHLATPNPQSELAVDFQTRLSASGVNWVDAKEAAYIVRLGPEQFNQRYLALSTQARATELQLTLRSRFSVVDNKGKSLIAPNDAMVVRQMEDDPGNVVGKAEETGILRREMRSDLVDQIMRRIVFFAAAEGAAAADGDATDGADAAIPGTGTGTGTGGSGGTDAAVDAPPGQDPIDAR